MVLQKHGDSGFTEEDEEYMMMVTRICEIACERILAQSLLEPHTTIFGMWIAGYCPVSDFWLVLKAWLGILAEFLGSFYADHVRFDPCHPYIERLPTL